MGGSGRDLGAGAAPWVGRLGWAAIVVALLAAGCGTEGSTGDACADHTCSGEGCPAPCGPKAPGGFEGPVLLWSGPEGEVPDCPVGAERTVYLGHGDLDDSILCPQCDCTAPACVFPAWVATNTTECPGTGTMTTYPLPVGWDGSCVAITPGPDPIGSMFIGWPTVVPCEPVAREVVAQGASSSPWSTAAKACGGAEPACGRPGEICPTTAPPPPGFRRCLAWAGDGAPVCPTEYPDKLTFYDDVDDTRSCSPCECTQRSESVCNVLVALGSDDACATHFSVEGRAINQTNTCQQGWSEPIRGVHADMVVDAPGTCAPSGGEPLGHAEPLDPSTFCCQQANE